MEPSKETPEEEKFVENRNTKQILIDTAKKCKLLIDEADELFSKRDLKGYKEKLVERAERIRDLPKELAQATDIGTEERREKVLYVVDSLAYLADRALKPRCKTNRALEPKHNVYYELNTLMGPESNETGDPNPLDVLIESMEK